MGLLWRFERDVTRPILSRDEPPFVPAEKRPVPRNMNISQDICKEFGYTRGCAKCMKVSLNEYSHPGLAHSQDCRTRIEAASRTDPVYRDRAERAEQRKMDVYAKEVERIDGPPTGEKEGEDQPSSRDTRTCHVKSLFRVQMRR